MSQANKTNRSAAGPWTAALIVCFIASRVIVYFAGVRFDARDIPEFMHFIDPVLLREDALASLFHLHAQPPVFNALLALAYKVTGSEPRFFLAPLFFLLGLGIAVHLMQLLLVARLPAYAAAAAAFLFSISPPAILYENYAFYTYLVTYLLLLCAVLFHRAWQKDTAASWFHFLLPCAILALTRGMFHLVWLLALALIPLVRCIMRTRVMPAPTLLLAIIVPLLPAAMVYGKNLAFHGRFTASTWLGLNLARMTVHRMPKAPRAELIKRGVLHPIAAISPFAPLEDFKAYMTPADAQSANRHALLRARGKSSGAVNYHHAHYIKIHAMYADQALQLIRARPEVYLQRAGRAYLLFLQPTAHWHPLVRNYRKIARYDRLYNRVFHFRIMGAPMGFYILLPLLLLAAGQAAFQSLRGRTSDDGPPAAMMLFLAGNVLYITLVGSLLDFGENNRFRFAADPYIFALAAMLIAHFRNLWRKSPA